MFFFYWNDTCRVNYRIAHGQWFGWHYFEIGSVKTKVCVCVCDLERSAIRARFVIPTDWCLSLCERQVEVVSCSSLRRGVWLTRKIHTAIGVHVCIWYSKLQCDPHGGCRKRFCCVITLLYWKVLTVKWWKVIWNTDINTVKRKWAPIYSTFSLSQAKRTR